MKIGYARVSTMQQDLSIQLDKLNIEKCCKIFSEKYSGQSATDRKSLQDALEFVRDGDSLVITRLDRLARSLSDLSHIASMLERKNVDLIVLEQHIDTRTPSGKLMFHMVAAFAEFERDLINERCSEGRAKAVANGVVFGRKAKLSPKQLELLKEEFQSYTGAKVELANKYGISRASLYRLANS